MHKKTNQLSTSQSILRLTEINVGGRERNAKCDISNTIEQLFHKRALDMRW